MIIEEKQVILRKLEASEGKVLRFKRVDYDDEGKEIPRDVSKEIYLAVTDSADNYEEIDERINDVENT